MKAWQIRGAYGIDNLKLVDVPEPKAGAGEVVVALRAASLNYRDLATIRGLPGAKAPAALVPCSDGAGVIEAVGSRVTGLEIGQRVAPTFFRVGSTGRRARKNVRSRSAGRSTGCCSSASRCAQRG
jgi:NADPH:quinone reductase-like Zn-dependent oxidoreductase